MKISAIRGSLSFALIPIINIGNLTLQDGGGIRAFHKYEKGIIHPPQTLVILFDLLDNNLTTLDNVRDSLSHKVA